MGNQRLDHLLSKEKPLVGEVETSRRHSSSEKCSAPLPETRGLSLSWLERVPDKDEVTSSTLVRPTTFRAFGHGGMAQLVERLLCKQDVAGSNPATSTSVWVSEAPPVSGGDARGASPFAFCSWQLAAGSVNLRFMIFGLRLRLAIRAFAWRRRPRRRALRGN